MKTPARRSDPATSHDAARDMIRSGRLGRQQQECLLEVRRRPGLTAAEVAANLYIERHIPSRRLPELERLGFVKKGEPRKCRQMGRSSVTWWAIEEEERTQGELF